MDEKNISEMEESDPPPAKRLKTDEENNLSEDITEPQTKETKDDQENNYQEFVSTEEIEKLKEFQVLDEVKSDDEDSQEDDSDDEKSEGETEVPEEEIDRMLDDNLPEEMRVPKPKEKPYVTRQKIILEEKGINHFSVLPLDWLVVRHYSGMPVYMHRPSRVCTLAKPYFIGRENTRRHNIPISAIPCLNYRRALIEEEKQAEIDRRIAEQIRTGAWKNEDQKPSENDKEVTSTQSEKNAQEGVEEVSSTDNSEITQIDSTCKNEESVTNEIEAPVTNSNDGSVLKCPFAVGNESVVENSQGDLVANINVESDQEAKPSSPTSDVETTQNNENGIKLNNIEVSNPTDVQSSETTKKSTDDVKDEHQFKCPYPVGKPNNEANSIQNSENRAVNDTTSASLIPDPKTVERNIFDQSMEEKEEEISKLAKPLVLPGGVAMPPPRVETAETSWKTKLLTHEEVTEYCKNLFKFKTINIMHFKRWADRRKYVEARRSLQYPALPRGSRLITIPQGTGGAAGGTGARRDWVMNMNGRSYLSVFHEYVRRALQKQPVYEFRQLENASSPYQATVYIGGMAYGVGCGSSKRLAKAAAARASIHVLIPDAAKADAEHGDDPDFSFFDYVSIEDPRIAELCAAACEPAPHAILRTCLLRNAGAVDKHIHTEMKKLEYQKVELTMRVGRHSATVVCKNKKTAKQRASQAILQALHPHISSWGSLLRLYGSRSVKSCKEKKQEEQEITLLQDKAKHNEPNYAVLEKLKLEMRKLRERDEAVVPIGTFLVKDDLPTHSGSNLNNVDL